MRRITGAIGSLWKLPLLPVFALTALACTAVISVALYGQNSSANLKERDTRQRLHEYKWWPTRGDATRQEYAGSEACAACHASEYVSQTKTSMAHAAECAIDSSVLRNAPLLSSQPATDPSPYQTTIRREAHGSEYKAARGGYSMRGQLQWAMGEGAMGQTYIVESGGALYEAHRTYFSGIKGLDETPGQSDRPGETLEEAFGRPLGVEESAACFARHTTQSSLRGQFNPSHAIPGISCEDCHGPGAKHVRAMQNNLVDEGLRDIFTPASLNPVEKNDFCGACHRAPLDVAAIKATSVPINIRFQPYRLAKSRCWSTPDARLACVACHNPHEEVRRDASYYDASVWRAIGLATLLQPARKQRSRPAKSLTANVFPATCQSTACPACMAASLTTTSESCGLVSRFHFRALFRVDRASRADRQS